MKLRSGSKEITGIHLQGNAIRIVRGTRENGQWHFGIRVNVPLPEGTLRPGFNRENICDPEAFSKVLEELKHQARIDSCSAALTLSEDIVKVMIKTYPQLPDKPMEIDTMVRWSLSRQIRHLKEGVNVSWETFPSSDGNEVLMVVALAAKPVLNEYVTAFANAGIRIVTVSPSVLALFNVYAASVPDTGNAAWIGIMDSRTSLILFANSIPRFFKTLRSDLVPGDSVDYVDMILKFCLDENPGLSIHGCYISTNQGQVTEQASKFETYLGIPCEYATPSRELARPEDPDFSFAFAPAMGAAWSINRR